MCLFRAVLGYSFLPPSLLWPRMPTYSASRGGVKHFKVKQFLSHLALSLHCRSYASLGSQSICQPKAESVLTPHLTSRSIGSAGCETYIRTHNIRWCIFYQTQSSKTTQHNTGL